MKVGYGRGGHYSLKSSWTSNMQHRTHHKLFSNKNKTSGKARDLERPQTVLSPTDNTQPLTCWLKGSFWKSFRPISCSEQDYCQCQIRSATARSGQPLPYRIGRSFHTSGWSAPVLYFWLNEILLLIITLNLPGLQLMAINLCFVIFHCWEEFDSSVLVNSPLSSSCRLQLGPGPLPLPINRSITDSILRLFSPW